MNKHLLILTLALFKGIFLFAQSKTIDSIENLVGAIDENSTLEMREIDTKEVYPNAIDGGVVVRAYYDNDSLKKIEQEAGLSFGRLTTTVYLNDGQPIKIIDTEENFPHLNGELDYTTLNPVFRADIYVYDWEMAETEVIKKGERVMSEGTCSVHEYEPFIEQVKKYGN